jgi:hypothetical protein
MLFPGGESLIVAVMRFNLQRRMQSHDEQRHDEQR